ncbi:PROTEIN SEY1 [Salix koriyanagi]|uniref:PROTEIN SEY1 n=1 Tax=Salix koriyanagi TaxID=2511006 RepID=A0A9Q0WF21_9ROSI|nr:PROTEIN SEY1 [Salix koriyanagi]
MLLLFIFVPNLACASLTKDVKLLFLTVNRFLKAIVIGLVMKGNSANDAAIQQSGWNADKFRKRLICNMLSEVMAKYEKQITHAIANTVESLLEASERNTWASVRDVFECNTEKAISEFSDAAASFDLRSSEINTKFQHLREFARNLLEMKAREEADAGRVLKRMMDRSKQVFDNYENSMSWYKSETNLDEIERKALSKSLRILSIMAAIRYDEMPDQIENVLYSSLMDRIVLNPSLQKTPMEAVLDPLALDTWEEVSQNSTTLLKPEDCESLWMMFIEEIKPMVTMLNPVRMLVGKLKAMWQWGRGRQWGWQRQQRRQWWQGQL